MYEWIKAFHLIAVISWMAGLLYLPRLFIYHCDANIGSDKSETFKVMERKLFKFIMTPAMIVTWIAGIYLLLEGNWLTTSAGWIYVKLTCLLMITGLHGMLGKYLHYFEIDKNVKSARFFRFINEAPTVLMIIIVILTIVKPF